MKVSQADPTVSGETTPSGYTMTQGTDYTMSYTPTGSNTGIEDRTVTVTITGVGKFSGQTKTVTYTQKADTACTTATTCTPSTSITYSNYSVSYVGGAVACNGTPSKSNITVTADKTTTTKDVFCQENSTTDNDVSITDFSVSYSPSGNNTGTSNRTVTGTVTHNGSTAGTFTFTQNSGSTCQATVTSTTYTYRIDAADFDACDSETTVTVYATPTYHYSDGKMSEGEETELSLFPLPTITYRLGTGTSVATASQNSTSSSRVWTVTASFRHNNSACTASDTATQSAGPCNTGSTGSTVYEYKFTNCYGDRQIALFASNATPSGSSLQYAMLSAMDGTTATVLVTSTGGTPVNTSAGSMGGYAYIGDSVKVYSVINSTSSWSLLETITLTAEDRSFSYGDCSNTGTSDCTCSVTKIEVSPTSHTFTSDEDYEFTVTITDNNCSGCTDEFDVYNSSGVWQTGGAGTFSLPNASGTYTIKSRDDNSKTCTVTTTKYTTGGGTVTTCILGTSDTNTGSTTVVSIETNSSGEIGIKSVNGTTSVKPTLKSKSTLLTSVTIGNELSSGNGIYLVNYTAGSTSGNSNFVLSNSCGSEFTVNVPIKKYTGSTTVYEIQALDTTIGACDTSATVTVQGRNKTISGYSDGSTYESTWTRWTDLTKDTHYTINIPTISKNESAMSSAYTATVNGKGVYNNLTDIATITQNAGPCTPPVVTCTTKNEWSSISVTNVSAAKCDTSASMTVTANGTHTNADCSTATTSTTLSSSNYTVKYGTTSGNYTLDNITANETTSTKTWYYKVTASNTYGSKTATGQFTQSAGPCTPTLTCNALDMSYVDSSKTMTATFEEMVASDVTINFKLNLSNSNSVSDSITISEGNNSGSKTLSTSQAITSTAGTSVTITSISPTKDTEYEYNCDTGYTITPSEAAPSYEFSVSTNSIVIDDWVYGQGGFVYVKSRKNGSKLSVSNSSSDFITVSATTNDNSSYDYKYLVIVEANNGTSYRDGSITFTQSETNDTETVSVRQIFNPYVNVTFTPNFTDGDITVASDFNAYYKEYGETVNYGAGNGDDDGNWTITWSHTPTYSGNAGTYNVLIYYWDYATVCGQTITVSACYKGGSHGERCGNDSGTGPTYTPATPQPSEPSIVTKDGYLQIYNPLSYAVIVYVQHYINGAASGSIISRTVQARSYAQLGWPATGTPTHGAVITSWDEA